MSTTGIQVEEVWARLEPDQDLLNPLTQEKAAELLRRARLGSAPRVLDVGCGTGGWSRPLLRAHPDADYLGIDVSPTLVDRAREVACDRGLEDRTTFEVADATTYRPPGRFDLIILMGLPAGFGTIEELLNLFRDSLSRGGALIYGDGIWSRPPPESALALTGEEADGQYTFEETVTQVLDAGWLPVFGHQSTEEEWDAFQWACVEALARWGLDEGCTHLPPLLNAYAYIGTWLHGYRYNMGFASFLLRPVPSICRVLGTANYHAIHDRAKHS